MIIDVSFPFLVYVEDGAQILDGYRISACGSDKNEGEVMEDWLTEFQQELESRLDAVLTVAQRVSGVSEKAVFGFVFGSKFVDEMDGDN